MLRTANTLRNRNFQTLLRRSSHANAGPLSKIIRWECTKSSGKHGPSVAGSSVPHQNEPSAAFTWLDRPSNWSEPYLTDGSRSASVDGMVKTILSSTNPDNRVDELPPLNHMACDDLISMLVAFDDAGLPTHCGIMRTLVEEITDQMENDSQAVSLHGMANFTVFANNNRHQMNKYLLCVDLLAPLLQRLATCDHLDEMHHITVCMTNLNRFVLQDSMKLYKSKLDELMANGKLNRDSDTMIIAKILRFLNFPPWSLKNSPTFRAVLELLLSRIEQLTDQELADMLTMYRAHCEPGAVVAPIVRQAEKRLLKQSPATNTTKHNIPLLYCCSMTEIPEKSDRILNCLDAHLDTAPTNVINDSLLFQMLRRNKQSARDVYDKYWSKVASELAAMDPKRTPNFDNMLSKACFRYCYFDNSQRGQYRHLAFEEVATKLAIDEINTGISGMIPRKFVKLATFLLGYGSHQTTHRFPEHFVQRVEGMVRQYSVHDILQLSRGVELFYTRGNCTRSKSMRSRINNDSSNQMCRVENLLDMYIKRYVTSRSKNVSDLNKLLYVYSASKMPKRTEILSKLIKSIEEEATGANFTLSSRIIRDVLNNLSKLNYMMPEISEKIMRYLYENRSTVCGELVGRALFNLYTLGYEPVGNVLLPDDQPNTQQQQQAIKFNDFGAIIERDFELMPGLTIVRACLALAFYRALSMELIEKVFNLNFLMRLESEISICYANAPYSSRSLNCIMQLNRAVCFGYPEARIPWFQQNYIEAHISSIVPTNSKFYEDISRMLFSLIGDKSLIETNHITPYGYRIPFVLYFNSNKEIVRPPIQKNTYELTKFAIIPLENRSYCYNTNIPRGEEQLQERHLGILGFNVIQICYGDWNKMHMNLPGAKVAFLRKILKLV